MALVFSFGVSFYEYTVHDTGIHAFLEPVGILFAILLATGVAFYFEQKANKQFEILNQVNDDIYYKVIRNERITQVLKKDIVVGDIVIIETGEEVPADGELLEAVSLHLNESTLQENPSYTRVPTLRTSRRKLPTLPTMYAEALPWPTDMVSLR